MRACIHVCVCVCEGVIFSSQVKVDCACEGGGNLMGVKGVVSGVIAEGSNVEPPSCV